MGERWCALGCVCVNKLGTSNVGECVLEHRDLHRDEGCSCRFVKYNSRVGGLGVLRRQL